MYFMSGSQNFDPASQLAEHLLSEGVQRQLYRTSSGYAVPAYDAYWNTPEIQADTQVSLKFREVFKPSPRWPATAYRGPVHRRRRRRHFQQIVRPT